MRRFLVALIVFVAAFPAAAQIVTITPAAPGTWTFNTGGGVASAPPAAYIAPGFETPPLGVGSAHLTPGSSGGANAQIRNNGLAGTRLDSLEALSYSTYVDVDGSGGQAPYMNLLIDQNGDGVSDDQLFFEPAYQTGAYPGDPVPNQGAIQLRTWQTWNALAGGWWSLDAGTFGPPLITIATYLASFPNATIVNTAGGLGGLRILTGTGAGAWDNFLGAVDNVIIDTTTTASTTYNFEPLAGSVVTVTPPTPDGWVLQTVDDGDATNTASTTIVSGPGTPPMGDGSLQLAIGADGADAAQARNDAYDGQLLRDLSSLLYSTYVQNPGSGEQAPYVILNVDFDGNGTTDDFLFFEPVYQTAGFFPSHPQPAIVVGSWQQWDARSGGWWAVNNTGGAGPGVNVKPLADIIDVQPDARLATDVGGSVRIVAGFGAGAWDNFLGNADALQISFATPTTTYDFEPVPAITIADVSLAEGTGGATNFVFNLTLSEAVSQTVTVQYTTADNTATTADLDYTSGAGTATFLPNTANTTITVAVTPDAKYELDETFFVNLANPQFATIGDAQAVGTIVNDDPIPTITIGAAPVDPEGNVNSSQDITLSLSNTSYLPVTVDYTFAPGTATAGVDYVATNGTLTIPAGDSLASISWQLIGDTIFEADETLTITFSNPTNATLPVTQATATIQNDDPAPAISIADGSAVEGNAGNTPMTFDVTLANASAFPVSVDYTITGNTATAGADFTSTNGTLTFAPGDVSETITVQVTGDLTDEVNETLTVTLSNPSAQSTIADGTATGTITDDDGQPTITIDDVTLAEGNAGTTAFTFTVTLSNLSASPVSVDYGTAPGTATAGVDYDTTSGTLIINPGSLTGQITVNAIGEVAFEPNESFFVNLTNPTNATIADAQGLGTITNDDGPVADLSITKTGSPGVRPGGLIQYTITVANAGPQQATDVIVTDVLPAGTTFVAATPSQGSCTGTTTITCDLNTILNGGSATIQLTITAPMTEGTVNNTATVTNTPETDPTPANNAGAAGTAVLEAIPTVSEWGLMAMIAALLGLAMMKMK
ncbi:MAG TPA: Calx-beta domain-containing protein [Thermoanaerobaculia bacterium]|nr:Calx-beta domain-containing protein [Thermoanaerobaculia bacterium]